MLKLHAYEIVYLKSIIANQGIITVVRNPFSNPTLTSHNQSVVQSLIGSSLEPKRHFTRELHF
jgi:hypothetical protein